MVKQFTYYKQVTFFLQYVIILSKCIGTRSTDIDLNLKGDGLNIKNVCKLSMARFPDKNHKVGDILRSYEVCLKTINQYSGKDRERLVQELANRLECFKEDLKQAYYAGNSKYKDIELVEHLGEEIQFKKDKLNANNFNLRKNPCNMGRKTRSTFKHIIPLVLTGTLSEKQKACEAVFKQEMGMNCSHMEIPTPKLDDNKDPKELTVPLTNPSTYKVDSPEADNALTQYYKVVMKCLTLTTQHQIQIFRFNKKFYDWLTTAVLPHLKDDKCYPAFGGVLRIVQTMQENDYVPKNSTANFIFYRQKNLEKQGEEIRRKNSIFKGKQMPPFVIYMIVWPIAFFLMILVCYECFLYRSRKRNSCDSESSYTEVFYYPIEGTPSISIDFESDRSRRASNSSYENDQHEDHESQSKPQRQRGGRDDQVFSFPCEHENTLMGVPLKRQWSSKESSSCLKSPGKRQRKTWKD